MFVQDVAFKESVIICAGLLFTSLAFHGLAYRAGQCKVGCDLCVSSALPRCVLRTLSQHASSSTRRICCSRASRAAERKVALAGQSRHNLAARVSPCVMINLRLCCVQVWPKIIELAAPVPFVAMIPAGYLAPGPTQKTGFITIK